MKGTRFTNRFSEKLSVREMGPFWIQKWYIHITLDPLKDFLKFFLSEGGQ